MNPIPDPTGIVPTPTPDRVDQAWSGGLSLTSILSGVGAMVAQVPQGTAVAVAGVFGSVCIQLSSQWNNKRTAQLERDLFHAQAAARAADDRESRHLSRIDSLVRQLDEEKARVDAANARADRMLAVALEHAGEMGSDVHRVIADAAKPAPAAVSTPAPAPTPAEPTGSDFTLTDPHDAPGGVS